MPSIAFLSLAVGTGARLELEGVVEQYVHRSQDSLGDTQTGGCPSPFRGRN